MIDTLNIDGLEVGPFMVRGYIERIAELEHELKVVRDLRQLACDLATKLTIENARLRLQIGAELESDNRRIRKVMQRYIDSQDNAKNNWVLDFLQVLEIEK